ncbi:MAG: BatD family protein, partial [Flavobacteriales bacterium]
MKNIFLHIVFCFASFQSLAQRPLVLLEIDPKEAGIGEALTITVKSNVEGEIQIDLPSGFVHGYNVMNGMEQEIDYNTGKVISYYYLSQTGAMPKAGTFKFGPAYVKKGNKVYRSNTVMVTIRKDNTPSFSGEELTAKQLRQPAFGVIEKAKSEIY